MKNKLILFTCIVFIFSQGLKAQSDSIDLKTLIEKSLLNSRAIENRNLETEKIQLDKRKAQFGYLPRIQAEASYNHLNSDICLPENMTTLLEATQLLLIKEKAGIPFNQPLTPELLKALSLQGVSIQEIPPIQEQNITKASINGQMLLFSGMKIPLSIKAANEAIEATEMLTIQEKTLIIKQVISTYDKLALVHQSFRVIKQSKQLLAEQERFVKKAYSNGLATDLDLQKIELAKQKLESKQTELISSENLIISRLSQLSKIDEIKLKYIKPQLNPFPIIDSIFDASNRYDIKALENIIEVNKLQKKIHYTEYIPKVFAFGKKELLTEDLSAFDPQWYVGIGLRWNIFDGFQSKHEAQKSHIDQKIMENRKSEALELADLKIKNSRFDIKQSGLMVMLAEKELEIAEKAYTISLKEYQNGIISLNEHLESLNDLEKAQLNRIEAIYNQRASVIELYDISGKLYETVVKILKINEF